MSFNKGLGKRIGTTVRKRVEAAGGLVGKDVSYALVAEAVLSVVLLQHDDGGLGGPFVSVRAVQALLTQAQQEMTGVVP